ncbi:MAG: ATP synthase F1 subunit gamma [Candidatus Levyibacteriota bacterium]
MASILHLKRRIQAAQNVSKTTRAMQMIAASKLKKAQEATLSIRPYVEKLTNLSANIPQSEKHPYLNQNNITSKSLIIILSPDKGLCGGLITNLVREFFHYQKDQPQSVYLTMGKKIETQVAKFKKEIIASFVFGTILPTFDLVYPITHIINEYYLEQKVDSVEVLSTHFDNLFTQKPRLSTLLPIVIPKSEKESDFRLFEPQACEILPFLLSHYLEMTVYQHLLESYLSEQASRMITMQNATTNANDIIYDLRLEYNKTRQARITSEILDIGGGANLAYE